MTKIYIICVDVLSVGIFRQIGRELAEQSWTSLKYDPLWYTFTTVTQ